MKTRASILADNGSKLAAQYYWQRFRSYPKQVTGIALMVPFTVLINGYLPALILANVRFRQDHLRHRRAVFPQLNGAL